MATRDEVLTMLEEDLSDELGSIIQYMWQHVSAKGLASAEVRDRFRAASMDEMRHAEELAERIDELGGTPTIRVGEIRSGGDLEKMLRDNVVHEEEAVERYISHIQAIGMADPTTRRLLEEILADEERHLNEWRTLLGE
ncbi:MAG: ferritin-like domain-containing protein [Chloroflexi bacterium]|nr:ferritin-like domain-containing protein [Chloroflexota bacterium]